MQTFREYADYVLTIKETMNVVKHSTLTRYRELLNRINNYIGDLYLDEITPAQLNSIYIELSQPGMNLRTRGKLSSKTILEYHRFISSVLSFAVKEMILTINVAEHATPSKSRQPSVQYFQIEDIKNINKALDDVSPLWKTLINVFIMTGARRGELLGLHWKDVDFKNDYIYICNNLLYRRDIGIYETTPKTSTSIRKIALPKETMLLLYEYKAWQAQNRPSPKDFVFVNDNGDPLHPDSVTRWLDRFSKKNNLPHISSKAFRHTMASTLLYEGVDLITVSKRLGHAKPSTTADVYSHIMLKADKQSAEKMADVFLRN